MTLTVDDVAALLYRIWIADRYPMFPWHDLDEPARIAWRRVAQLAIDLAPGLTECPHVSEAREPLYDPESRNTIIGYRHRCRKCGRTRAESPA